MHTNTLHMGFYARELVLYNSWINFFFLSYESLFQWTAQKRCLEPSVLRQSLTHMSYLKSQHHLAFLLEDHIQLEVRLVQPMFYLDLAFETRIYKLYSLGVYETIMHLFTPISL
jgi:hypothetical protein